eukprot:Skav225739  [mRNA]  locus=scaffold28:49634:49984:+ [translate_table: standard]
MTYCSANRAARCTATFRDPRKPILAALFMKSVTAVQSPWVTLWTQQKAICLKRFLTNRTKGPLKCLSTRATRDAHSIRDHSHCFSSPSSAVCERLRSQALDQPRKSLPCVAPIRFW